MEKTIFEEMGGTYRQEGDQLIPNIGIPKSEKSIQKYGLMRRKYLKEQLPEQYSYLMLTGTLEAHLLEIEEAAQRRLDEMMPTLTADAGATEQLKRDDPLKWVGLMNTCKAQAEEVIYQELIYA